MQSQNNVGGDVYDGEAIGTALFNQFVNAGTFRSILSSFQQLCDGLGIKNTDHRTFYSHLKARLTSWKAQALWAKLDKRACHKDYKHGETCKNTRVLIIGSGPCGMRTAIEVALLGGKAVVVEKRDSFSRNNVLHLWPFLITDLRNLAAKKFFGKFCAGAIDHISIRQLQIILVKVALLLGVEVHVNVTFEGLIEPTPQTSKESSGWKAKISPAEHLLSEYEFDVLIDAGGKRNTLVGIKRKEFRGKLAIAITANFINRNTQGEARVEEISGVAFIFNQKFFQDLYDQTGINLENIVYYKDDTHYFVMTAKKQSLLDKGVLLQDHSDTVQLLSKENVNHEALLDYAREAADFSTNHDLPALDYAVNHYGKEDVAMFDFTSMYAAENSSKVMDRNGQKLLIGLVGDSLLEPFWPTGSGCARGFLGVLDAAWMIRRWASAKQTCLEILAERESIYLRLSQTTPENLQKNFNHYSIDPSTRYPNMDSSVYKPEQMRHLLDTGQDAPTDETININVTSKKSREAQIDSYTLLRWCQSILNRGNYYSVHVTDYTTSWRNGMALCALIHHFRPSLIDYNSLSDADVTKNNQLAFDVAYRELCIAPTVSATDMAKSDVPDKLTMLAYLSQFYEVFKKEELPPLPVNIVKPPPKAKLNLKTSSRRTSLLNRISHRLSKAKRRKDRERSNSPKDFNFNHSWKRQREEKENIESLLAQNHNRLPMEELRNRILGINQPTVIKPKVLPDDMQSNVSVKQMGEMLVSKFRGYNPGQDDNITKGMPQDIQRKMNPKSLLQAAQPASEMCCFCKRRVYIMERMCAEGYFFHRGCLKCAYCDMALRLGNYAFEKSPTNGEPLFYCYRHSGMMQRRSRKRNRPSVNAVPKHRKHILGLEEKGPPAKISPVGPSKYRTPKKRVENSCLSPTSPNPVHTTPERAEFENSFEGDAEETEEEQTDHNLRLSQSSESLFYEDEGNENTDSDDDIPLTDHDLAHIMSQWSSDDDMSQEIFEAIVQTGQTGRPVIGSLLYRKSDENLASLNWSDDDTITDESDTADNGLSDSSTETALSDKERHDDRSTSRRKRKEHLQQPDNKEAKSPSSPAGLRAARESFFCTAPTVVRLDPFKLFGEKSKAAEAAKNNLERTAEVNNISENGFLDSWENVEHLETGDDAETEVVLRVETEEGYAKKIFLVEGRDLDIREVSGDVDEDGIGEYEEEESDIGSSEEGNNTDDEDADEEYSLDSEEDDETPTVNLTESVSDTLGNTESYEDLSDEQVNDIEEEEDNLAVTTAMQQLLDDFEVNKDSQQLQCLIEDIDDRDVEELKNARQVEDGEEEEEEEEEEKLVDEENRRTDETHADIINTDGNSLVINTTNPAGVNSICDSILNNNNLTEDVVKCLNVNEIESSPSILNTSRTIVSNSVRNLEFLATSSSTEATEVTLQAVLQSIEAMSEQVQKKQHVDFENVDDRFVTTRMPKRHSKKSDVSAHTMQMDEANSESTSINVLKPTRSTKSSTSSIGDELAYNKQFLNSKDWSRDVTLDYHDDEKVSNGSDDEGHMSEMLQDYTAALSNILDDEGADNDTDIVVDDAGEINNIDYATESVISINDHERDILLVNDIDETIDNNKCDYQIDASKADADKPVIVVSSCSEKDNTAIIDSPTIDDSVCGNIQANEIRFSKSSFADLQLDISQISDNLYYTPSNSISETPSSENSVVIQKLSDGDFAPLIAPVASMEDVFRTPEECEHLDFRSHDKVMEKIPEDNSNVVATELIKPVNRIHSNNNNNENNNNAVEIVKENMPHKKIRELPKLKSFPLPTPTKRISSVRGDSMDIPSVTNTVPNNEITVTSAAGNGLTHSLKTENTVNNSVEKKTRKKSASKNSFGKCDHTVQTESKRKHLSRTDRKKHASGDSHKSAKSKSSSLKKEIKDSKSSNGKEQQNLSNVVDDIPFADDSGEDRPPVVEVFYTPELSMKQKPSRSDNGSVGSKTKATKGVKKRLITSPEKVEQIPKPVILSADQIREVYKSEMANARGKARERLHLRCSDDVSLQGLSPTVTVLKRRSLLKSESESSGSHASLTPTLSSKSNSSAEVHGAEATSTKKSHSSKKNKGKWKSKGDDSPSIMDTETVVRRQGNKTKKDKEKRKSLLAMLLPLKSPEKGKDKEFFFTDDVTDMCGETSQSVDVSDITKDKSANKSISSKLLKSNKGSKSSEKADRQKERKADRSLSPESEEPSELKNLPELHMKSNWKERVQLTVDRAYLAAQANRAPRAEDESYDSDDSITYVDTLQRCSRDLRRSVDLDEKLARRIKTAARRQQKAKEQKRLRIAQELQRHLEEVDEKQHELEERGVQVEMALRGEGVDSGRDEAELMQEWFNLVHEKNILLRYESELMVRAKELELEDRQSRLEQELRDKMTPHDIVKSSEEADAEKRILDELLEVVEQRDNLVHMLEEQRLKGKEEDDDLESVMTKKGFTISPVVYIEKLSTDHAGVTSVS